MTAVDFFVGTSTILAPIAHGAAVTPHDTNELAFVTRGIIVGVAGNVKVTLASGDVVTLPGLAAGVIHPVRAKVIWSTGTTATTIVALW